jgi:hypothetical protein
VIGLVLKAVTRVIHSLETPDAVEYAIRLADGTVLTSRDEQEDRRGRLLRSWPEAELVERPVWYGEWDLVP